VLTSVASSSEYKIWQVPRLDKRNINETRHSKDISFPGVKEEDLPLFVLNVKYLWSECFSDSNGGDHQQPSRPTTVTSTCNARFLNHSSIKSGWSHINSSLFQMGKVY
jgi:hypothetical protein